MAKNRKMKRQGSKTRTDKKVTIVIASRTTSKGSLGMTKTKIVEAR